MVIGMTQATQTATPSQDFYEELTIGKEEQITLELQGSINIFDEVNLNS